MKPEDTLTYRQGFIQGLLFYEDELSRKSHKKDGAEEAASKMADYADQLEAGVAVLPAKKILKKRR